MKLFANKYLMNFIYFRPPVQNQKFPSINYANVPLQPKVTTSFEMIFHFRFVVYNYPLPCAPRIEGACLQGMVMPCPLRISSACKEEVISKVNSTSPFASWRRLVLEALDAGWQKTCRHGKTGKCSHASKHTQTLKVHPMIHPAWSWSFWGFSTLVYSS